MWPNPQDTADLVTLTEEILNEKLHFLFFDDQWLVIHELIIQKIELTFAEIEKLLVAKYLTSDHFTSLRSKKSDQVACFQNSFFTPMFIIICTTLDLQNSWQAFKNVSCCNFVIFHHWLLLANQLIPLWVLMQCEVPTKLSNFLHFQESPLFSGDIQF